MLKKKRAVPSLFSQDDILTRRSGWIFAAYFLLAFFSADGSALILDFLLGFLLAVCTLIRGRRISAGRWSVQLLAMGGFVLFAGISCFYADSGSLALQGYASLFAAWLTALLITLYSGSKGTPGRNAAAAVSFYAAAVSLVSIDAVGTHWLSGLFQAAGSVFTLDYSVYTGLEAGVRITGVLSDCNIFAGVAGLGVLLSLGLANDSTGRERIFHLVCLALSSLGFVLVFSLGAMGAILAAFVVLLICTSRKTRLNLLVLMIAVLLVTMPGAFVIYKTVFDGTVPFSLIPDLTAAAACVILCLLDRVVLHRAAKIRAVHLKAAAGVLCVLAVAYGAAAWNLTGPAALTAGTSLRRAASLPAGEYTLQTSAAGDVQMTVSSQTERQLIMHQNETLAEGGSELSFTVPEGSRIVWFTMDAQTGVQISKVSYQGAASGALKLDYRLLPGFIATRLQGLSANENAFQRIQYWRDALKIWKQSPVFGNGFGCMENDLYSVQPFFYQTKSAHNYYIQCLANCGVIGLILFLGMMGTAAWSLIAGLRHRRSPLLPALGASLVFTVLIAGLEVVMEAPPFLLMAFAVLALINVCSAPQEDGSVSSKQPGRIKAVSLPVIAGITAGLSLILFLGFYGDWYVPNGEEQAFDRLETGMKIDVFHRKEFENTYLYYSRDTRDDVIKMRAAELAEDLLKRKSNTDPCYAAEYYFSVGDVPTAATALLDHVMQNRSRSSAWQYAFDLLEQNDDGSSDFRTQAERIAAAFHAWEKISWEEISLPDNNQAYLSQLNG